jgi:hypothetical protein
LQIIQLQSRIQWFVSKQIPFKWWKFCAQIIYIKLFYCSDVWKWCSYKSIGI